MQAEPERIYVRATVAYDGTDFLGFQLQSQGRTVQGVLEAALARVSGHPVRVTGSGRTDAGVHALGQVVGFRVPWRHGLTDLQRALNAVLAADVAVSELREAPEGWHARFSATRRTYRYTVLNRPLRSPLERRFAHLVREMLDLQGLQAGAAVLVGEHDFASFGRPTQGDSTIRRVDSTCWQREGDRLTFDVAGNAFLRGMVRCIVGAMLQVGLGRWPVSQMQAVLEARNRTQAAPPAPACGLCLMQVDYERGPFGAAEAPARTWQEQGEGT